MVFLLEFLKQDKSSIQMVAAVKDTVAKISGDYWDIKQIFATKELLEYLSEKPLVHLIIYDVCDKEALKLLAELRKNYPQPQLMILADMSISPMEYIRPDLKVSSLLIKPWTKQQLNDVLCDFLNDYVEDSAQAADSREDAYVVETREGTINIPYEQIYFFEAREKKIYVCIGKEAYGFYSAIDKLVDELPSYFARCHRGFIVNTKKIRKIVLSQNIIYLSDGFDVPLSRSYKSALKGIKH